MKLIIVESPAKAKKIQSFFKNNVIVKSSLGHINNFDFKRLRRPFAYRRISETASS